MKLLKDLSKEELLSLICQAVKHTKFNLSDECGCFCCGDELKCKHYYECDKCQKANEEDNKMKISKNLNFFELPDIFKIKCTKREFNDFVKINDMEINIKDVKFRSCKNLIMEGFDK
jgi:hypothetical protein